MVAIEELPGDLLGRAGGGGGQRMSVRTQRAYARDDAVTAGSEAGVILPQLIEQGLGLRVEGRRNGRA